MFGYDREKNGNGRLELLVLNALNLPDNGIAYFVSKELAVLFPEKAVLEGKNNRFFDVETFAAAGLCRMVREFTIHTQIGTDWNERENQLGQKIINGYFKVEWQEYQLDLLLMNWYIGSCKVNCYWVLADTEEIANNFITTVCETISKWRSQTGSDILVFESGFWYKDKEIFEAIKYQTFNNLILSGTLKDDILNDITSFYKAKEKYKKSNIPWQRSYLFSGAPGLGKSHLVKALVNHMQLSCLYVRSFESSEFYSRNSEENMRYVFQQARQSAPCTVVLEDLDSLLTKQNRSFFLNQLDGFSSNNGVIILATTNHPERIDSAVKRPGRFDRHYYFDLPDVPERVAYTKLVVEQWNIKLSESAIERVANSTAGFSFADLREVFIFSLKQSMNATSSETMDRVIFAQIELLKGQKSKSGKNAAK